ncbi:vacuolar alkaline phosphatase [Coemansia sp. RSA 1972]|nr:vacuolar alkaline phosphatase [Coemansia sp. RSA 1972]
MLLLKVLLVCVVRCTSAKRNLVFMISDGFGSTSETMARSYLQQLGTQAREPWSSILDSMLVGSVRTQSSNSLITDSAAGATAFSCGLKTYNGATGVDADGMPCGTILEAAKNAGYTTGLVTTSRITHATPASFAAHVADRDMEDLIAMHMLAKNASTQQPNVDLMFGGGLCRFLPQSNDASCRSDDVDVWQAAKDSGVTTLTQRTEFNMLSQTTSSVLPLIGLFAPSHMAYTIDRDSSQPSLSEMTQTALDLLNTSEIGFFLMVEGARIDMAGHDNDPAAHVHDIIEYWRTVQKVHQFVHSNPDTLVVSTSDHETGGLALGVDPEYVWHPRVLKQVTKSAEQVCSQLFRMQKQQDVTEVIKDHVFPEYLGIDNHTQSELQLVVDALQVEGGDGKHKACKHAIGGVVSKRARVGWSTGGHTGADVGLYAYGNQMHDIKGNIENSHLGTLLMQYLGVDTRPITKALANTSTRQLAFVHSPHHDHD